MRGLKFLIGFAFILSAGSLAGDVFLYQRLQTERTLRQQLEAEKVQLEERSSQLESQVAKSNQYLKEAERLREQIKGYVSQRDATRKELEQTYKQMSDLRKQIKALDSEKGVLAQEVTIGEETEKAIVREAVKIPSVHTPAATLIAPSERPHQILSVNRQFKFVVVNLGIRDRLKLGDLLRVEEGSKLIGRLKVEKLYENFSACSIVEEGEPNKLKEGDLVRPA